MRIFLSGPMGAGKSTLAKMVADKLALPAIDLDEVIETRAGSSIAAIFREAGESRFRELEREALESLLAKDAVVALGGGAVVDADTRHALLDAGILITLQAKLETLLERVEHAERGRPLLGNDPRGALKRILEARLDAYAEAHAVIHTDTQPPEAIVEEVLRVAKEAPVAVALGRRSYRVEIGQGIRERVLERAQEAGKGPQIVVYDGDADRPWPAEIMAQLGADGTSPLGIWLEGDEAHKSVASIEKIWDAALAHEVDRDAVMIGVGGGVIGDLTGFAASTLLRGIAFGQVPTTLLAMVDSSVGGKTGFNRSFGKNLVGTFYQPSFVLCDIETLATLSLEERRAGLAEVVKSAWLDGPTSVELLERDAEALLAANLEATERAVRMSVALKAKVVRQDERETGTRMLLNLGHTLGHAFEASAGYQGIRHGEAVALGMIAAAKVGRALGVTSEDQALRLHRLIDALGLPSDLEARLSDEIIDFVASDKKRRGDRVHFVLPREPGQTQIQALQIDELKRLLSA